MSEDLKFGFVVAPVGGARLDDGALYREVIADCRLGQALGYDSAWMLEHHFSDYFPTPSPLLFMAHVAAHCPGLSFGSSVLVAPWYHPLRLLGEISMLSNLTEGELFIGVGRGTAKMEYDAFDVNMEQARDRLRECLEIMRLGLTGEPFTYAGEHFRIGIGAAGDTWAEVERELELAPGALTATVELYNHHAAQGQDPQFHKAAKWLRPLVDPPFVALDLRVDYAAYTCFTLGGLHTRPSGEVLNAQGLPIHGLYAAGRTACGLPRWGEGYSSGLSLADATYFGREAGRAAAG